MGGAPHCHKIYMVILPVTVYHRLNPKGLDYTVFDLGIQKKHIPVVVKMMGLAWDFQSAQQKFMWAMNKNTGCLGYIGDYTTQLCADY